MIFQILIRKAKVICGPLKLSSLFIYTPQPDLVTIRHFSINKCVSIEQKMIINIKNILRVIHTLYFDKVTNNIVTRGQ